MKKGQVIIAAIFVLAIIAILAMVAVALLSGESVSAVKNYHGIQALNVAEGGMRFTLATSLAADSDWSNNTDFGPVTLNPGVFTVHYVSKSSRNCSVEVTGTVQGVSRTVAAGIKGGTGGMPRELTDYAVFAGVGGGSSGEACVFHNQSKIIGSFYFYGPLQIQPPRPPACQTGGIIYSTTIDPVPSVGIPGYYTSWEAATPPPLVTWDNSYWDSWLNVANQSCPNSVTMTGTENKNLSEEAGSTWYVRDLTMRDSATITGPGTICCTANPHGAGDFDASNYARIKGGPVRIICRGTGTSVNLTDYVSFDYPVEIIGFDNVIIGGHAVVPRGSILYSRSVSGDQYGVQMASYGDCKGTVLSPYGQVSNNNDASIEGFSFSHDYQAQNAAVHAGGCIFYHLGNFYNDSKIIQDRILLPDALPPGLAFPGENLSSSLEISGWGEVYN